MEWSAAKARRAKFEALPWRLLAALLLPLMVPPRRVDRLVVDDEEDEASE
jgi:hypothetical protein